MKSLFTSIPLQLALDCTENAIKNSTVELPLPTGDIMELLNLCLTSTYFQYSSKNNYNTDFVRRNTHSNTDSNTQTNSGPVTTATIPYIRGTSETIARILQPYNIRVAQKPTTTLRLLLNNVNEKDKLEERQGAVYKFKCYDCQATYNGGTGEKFCFWFQVWRIRREGAFYEL